ncbi:L,D-transpeptidase [Microbacterium schleiferi]|uniref:L,D-transpeptidase n=1 Tax=Microbacterium schleiferi TaxID=69362 RepID=A0A7S8MZF5_9MICO|nr:L,D-transpeptidase [Microbacterium schleiferi]QPE05518.1 L,D-transpeptidase [Microbacterium schleiferi]
MATTRTLTRRNAGWIALAVAGVLVAAALVIASIVASWRGEPLAAAPSPTPTATVEPTPTPTPTLIGPAADTTDYDLAGLPEITVFAVVPELPVDDDPFGGLTGVAARAAGAAVPVFAEPGAAPVASLPRDYYYDGTVVPVIEQYDAWVKVMLVGRQAYPSGGNSGQLTGWLRTQDVELTAQEALVEVSLGDRTVDIVRGGDRQRVAADFGSGVEATPTPLGRSFIMTVRTEPTFTYTRGNPITYLSVQSPTLDGFDGGDVAVTAFHYHDTRSGRVSNGCLRVDEAAAHALSTLPLGTPVIIRE